MERRNEMKLEFEALSVNEGFARVAIAAFCARMNPTLDELEDIKTAVSEAVTNAIIHGYEEKEGTVVMQCCLSGSTVHITVNHRSRLRHRECRQGHGAALHHCHGRKQIGHGIFIYGGFHG